MLLLTIWLLLAFCNYSGKAQTVPETVYIDDLIQKYLTAEKEIWSFIYAPNNKNQVNTILYQIRNEHDSKFEDAYLEYVMNVLYMSKFIDYVDFYNLQTDAEGYEHKIMSLTSPQAESYRTVDMVFGVYSRSEYLSTFRRIRDVSERTVQRFLQSFWNLILFPKKYKFFLIVSNTSFQSLFLSTE